MAKDTLHVRVISPTQTIFEGDALSISSKNAFGDFDILPYHANFITLIQNAAITIRIREQSTPHQENIISVRNIEKLFKTNIRHLKFQFPIAIIYTKNNNVTIYTDIQLQLRDQRNPLPGQLKDEAKKTTSQS